MFEKQQDSYVMINVWPSSRNKVFSDETADGNVGHVSLQIRHGDEEAYASFWPAPGSYDSSRNQLVQPFVKRGGHFKNTYTEDKRAEASGTSEGMVNASVRLVLYDIDPSKMLVEFERMQNGGVTGWKLVGSNTLMPKIKSTSKENCASLAYRLLKEGGINKHHSSKGQGTLDKSNLSSLVSPDKIIKRVLEAKQEELKRCPETADLKVAGEMSVDDILAQFKAAGEKPELSVGDKYKPIKMCVFM